jgi:hypothetical protein
VTVRVARSAREGVYNPPTGIHRSHGQRSPAPATAAPTARLGPAVERGRTAGVPAGARLAAIRGAATPLAATRGAATTVAATSVAATPVA